MILLVIMLNTQYLVHDTTGVSALYSVFDTWTLVIMLNTQYLVHDTTGDNAQYSVFGT